MAEVLIDSHSEAYHDAGDGFQFYGNWTDAKSGFGQFFSTPANPQYKICKAKFYLKRIGNPDGKLEARLYSIKAGRTCGVNSEPANTPSTETHLATSNSINMSAVGTGSFALYDFTFPAGEQYIMDVNTDYIILLRAYDWTNPEYNVNAICLGNDYTAPTDDGNGVEVNPNNTWDDTLGFSLLCLWRRIRANWRHNGYCGR